MTILLIRLIIRLSLKSLCIVPRLLQPSRHEAKPSPTQYAQTCQAAFNGDPNSRPTATPLQEGTGGEAPPPGQSAGTNHPNPFYADHHWLPFHRCTMRRSFYNQREGQTQTQIRLFRGHPFKLVNKPRATAEENPEVQNTCRTQRRESVSHEVDWIRKQRRGIQRGVLISNAADPAGIPAVRVVWKSLQG